MLARVLLCAPVALLFIASNASGQWTPTAAMNTPRYLHTATLLPSGKVLVTGGVTGSNAVTASAELFDPVTATWAATGDLVKPRSGHSAVLLGDGTVLIVGGYGVAGPKVAVDAELYFPATGRFALIAGPRTPREAASVTLLADGRVLVAGGVDANDSALNTSEVYDPATLTWQYTGNLNYPRFDQAAVQLNDGRVLVAGGSDDDFLQTAINTAEIYDPASGTWSVVQPMSVARDSPVSVLLASGKVLAASGTTHAPSVSYASSETFDPATGWSAAANLNVARSGATATVLAAGDVLVAGGYNWNTRQDVGSAELYSAPAGTWSFTADMTTTRVSHTATRLADGRVLVAGGEVVGPSYSNIPIATAELYGTAAPSAVNIGSGFTGAWYDPAQSGHGLFLEVLPGSRLLAAWFTFTPNGDQAWFYGVGDYVGSTATIKVDQPTGGRWIPNFDPKSIVHNAWGTLTFTFSDCNHGRVDFASTLGYGSGSMSLTRLTQPAGLACQP